MRGFTHEKGFKIIEMSPKEAKILGFGIPEGCICMHCNEIIKGDIYYIPVLNDVMDKDCLDKYISTATYYIEDKYYEDKYYKYYMELLENIVDVFFVG